VIVNVPAHLIGYFNPLIRELVARENARGDTMDAEALVTRVNSGGIRVLAFFENNENVIPLILILYSAAEDVLRGGLTMMLEGLFVPSGTELREKFSAEDKTAFATLLKQYARVLFLSEEEKVLTLAKDLGFKATAMSTLWKLEAEDVLA
jgi:hypothetical protein